MDALEKEADCACTGLFHVDVRIGPERHYYIRQVDHCFGQIGMRIEADRQRQCRTDNRANPSKQFPF